MKKLIALLLLLTAVVTIFAETTPKQILISDIVLTLLDRLHYEPLEINDDLSADIYEMYLKNLDNSKRFLLQSDIEQLSNFELLIDDELIMKFEERRKSCFS